MKKELNANSSAVIAFGGSYGGMLSAWFRIKYSHLVAGAWASSAPIWLFQGLTDPYAFNAVPTNNKPNLYPLKLTLAVALTTSLCLFVCVRCTALR
jgi:hypothetical protein